MINEESVIKKALQKIRELTAENIALKNNNFEKDKKTKETKEIAVVGVACELPSEINNPADLWKALAQKETGVSKQYRSEFTKTKQAQYGGFIKNPYEFAVDFFGISRRELQTIDPQQRLLLEIIWRALENAGIRPSSLCGKKVGVFIGLIADDYAQYILDNSKDQSVGPHFASSTSHSTAAGRISHWFDFKGPCIFLNTACSSGLVAIHLARQSLINQECDLAIVASSNCLLTDVYFQNFSEAGMLAQDGQCKVFDDRADGYVRSEGAIAFILQSLDHALEKKASILGILKGSAINHDGRCSSLTVPSGPQQKAVIESALESAGISFNDLTYIEAHGTGTSLGDPVELNALGELCSQHQRKTPLWVGSVKANVGHLEPAAGLAGLLKILLILQENKIPPQPNFEKPSRFFKWESTPIKIPEKIQDIKNIQDDASHFLGVSSFGFSGTNAHVILSGFKQEGVVLKDFSETLFLNQKFILRLSAKSPESLLNYLILVKEALKTIILRASDKEAEIHRICWALNTGREIFSLGLVFVEHSADLLLKSIHECIDLIKTGIYQVTGQKLFRSQVQTQIQDISHYFDPDYDWNRAYPGVNFRALSLLESAAIPTYPFIKETIKFEANQKNPDLYTLEFQEAVLSEKPIDYLNYSWGIYSNCSNDFNKGSSSELSAFFSNQKINFNNLNLQENSKESHKESFKENLLDFLTQASFPNKKHKLGLIYFYQNTDPLNSPSNNPSDNPAESLKNLLQETIQFMQSVLSLKDRLTAPLEIWFVLKNQKDFSSELALATLRGLYRSFALERPDLIQGCLVFSDSIVLKDINAGQFFQYLAESKKELELKIDHADGKISVPRIAPYVLNSSELNVLKTLKIKPEGVYVITGGTGGIGQHLLNYLIQQGVQKIALLSRHPAENKGSIISFSVDLKSEKKLHQALKTIEDQLGEITGVFHAAGFSEYKSLGEIDQDHIESVFLPKVAGALSLKSYFKHKENSDSLEFILSFASIAAVWGAPHLAVYSAANLALEVMGENQKYHVVHWGPWLETGMAKHLKEIGQERSGMTSFQPAEALSYLPLIFKARKTLIAAKIDWKIFLRIFQMIRPINLFKKLDYLEKNTEKNLEIKQKINLDNPEKLQPWIKSIAAAILVCDPENLDIHQPLQELGFDSILGLELVQRLQKITSQKLPDTLIFDCPTLWAIELLIRGDHKPKEFVGGQFIAPSEWAQYEPIAIVGLSCRVGGSQSPEDFWNALISGEPMIKSDIRLELAQRSGKNIKKELIDQKERRQYFAGNCIKNINYFDPKIFRISHREACLMDPQQRLSLMLAWEAFESAGYQKENLKESNTGVFIGIGHNEYKDICQKYRDPSEALLDPTSHSVNLVSGRISYFFGLLGPSLVLDTACSSSLMAIHQACQSLRLGEIDLALAGGVNTIFSQEGMQSLLDAKMLSPSGQCKVFDQKANGYVRAEGAGLVVLQKLEDARKQGRKILGIIRSTAANQDGQTASMTAPSGQAQKRVMKTALKLAGLEPNQIDFIESHGTGTPLGDPIEYQSIQEVYADSARTMPLYLNSIKSQIGHAESASGVLSLIRALGSIRSGWILPQWGFENLNAHINAGSDSNFDSGFILIPKEKIKAQVQIGAVSSFGFSGTNVHLILSQAEDQTEDEISEKPFEILNSTQDLFNLTDCSIVPWEETQKALQLYETHWIKSERHLALFKSNIISSIHPSLFGVSFEEDGYEPLVSKLNQYALLEFSKEFSNRSNSPNGSNPSLAYLKSYVDLMSERLADSENESAEALEKKLEKQLENSVAYREYRLIKHIGRHLPEILEGRKSGLSILFQEGSAELVTEVYQNSPESIRMNQLLVHSLKNLWAHAESKGECLKILEVGAGTGGTTRHVLNALENLNNSYEYVFTDHSRSLLLEAKEKFSHVKNMRFEFFDLEKDLDISEDFFQKFDCVIAANVLHATQFISKALKKLYACLKDNGVLLIFEGTQPLTWLDFVFGITPGWWAFEDKFRSHPFLNISQWKMVLSEQGFDSFAIDPQRQSGQSVLIAQKVPMSQTNTVINTEINTDKSICFIDPQKENNPWEVLEKRVQENNHHVLRALVWMAENVQDIQDWDIKNGAHQMAIFCQFLAKKQQSVFSNLSLYVLTQRGVYIPGDSLDLYRPLNALYWGAASAIRAEYPQLDLVLIDLENDKNKENKEIYFHKILERAFNIYPASHWAYRHADQYEAVLQVLVDQKIQDKKLKNLEFKNQTWIITGGSGGLARIVGEWLIDQGAKKIILLGRRELKELKELKNSNHARINYHCVDITDSEAIERFKNSLGSEKISGLMHLAGALSDKAIREITESEFDTVFSAKIQGTGLMIELAKSLSIKNFIGFSTASAVLGNVGQVNHAAANAAMEALINKNQRFFDQAFCIQWGPWFETGAASNQVLNYAALHQMNQIGVSPYTNKEGLLVLEKAWMAGKSCVLAIEIDWIKFRSHRLEIPFYNLVPSSLSLKQDDASFITPVLEPEIEGHQPTVSLQEIKKIFAERLSCEPENFKDREGFMAYGVDSLMAISLAHLLNKKYGLSLDSTVLFDYPTFEDLYDFLNKNLNKSLNKNKTDIPEESDVRSLLRGLLEEAN